MPDFQNRRMRLKVEYLNRSRLAILLDIDDLSGGCAPDKSFQVSESLNCFLYERMENGNASFSEALPLSFHAYEFKHASIVTLNSVKLLPSHRVAVLPGCRISCGLDA